jgi:polysaccharide export outer membrane protein
MAVPAATPNSELRAVPEDFTKLRLAPGFLLALSVLDDTDFAGNFRVDEQGNIALPVLGELHVDGETVFQVRNTIRNMLVKEKILNDPQVSLTILEYTAPEVTILGEVAGPGRYPLLVPTKLVDVLALAGGPSLIAGNEVQISSRNPTGSSVLVHYSRSADPKSVDEVLVRPGDTIQVKRAGIVYVLGAVTRPGGYVMQEDGRLNVLQAISLANGTSTVASTKTIYIIRRNPDGGEVYMAVAYKKLTQGKVSDLPLRAADILFVPTSGTKSVLINGQGILAAAASASIYTAAVY